jgi:hypothetical protein
MNTSPSPVAMWACEAGSPPAASIASTRFRTDSSQGPGLSLAASSAPSRSKIAQPRISGEISIRYAAPRSACAAISATSRHRLPEGLAGAASGMRSKYRAPVSLAQGSWLAVVIVCAVACVLLALSGYTGYSIVVGAVGLSAAVNLT